MARGPIVPRLASMTTATMPLQTRSFDIPDETLPASGLARIETIRLEGTTVNRVTFRPGFRWTEHARPAAGTDLCEVRHTGYVVSGRAGIRLADGTERELVAGDVFDIPPGHDAWVIGDEPYVAVDFGPAPPTVAEPLVTRPSLDNSTWYGSALISRLATGATTGGRYAVQTFRSGRGFAPPAPHRHGPEDFYILSGQVRFWVAEREVVAGAGDLVRTVPDVWHTLQVESDEAEILMIFSPPGLEGFFETLGRPAEALELPGGRVGPPDPNRLREIGPRFGIEFAPPGTTPADIPNLP